MLITRNLKVFIEKYIIRYFNDKICVKNSLNEYDKKMLETVGEIVDFYSKDNEKAFFIRRCIAGRKNWYQAYDEIHIERRTYFAWKEEVLQDAVILAAINGLLDIKSG